MASNTNIPVSVVVIGRNEGPCLTQCLESVLACQAHAEEVLYVDSASTDDSVARATHLGVPVLRLDSGRMTAARGRNAGWRATSAEFVLFVDGDCVLDPQFTPAALESFQDPSIGVVWGVLRERHPRASVYQRAMSLDWIYPLGDSEFCGGNAIIRRSVLQQTGGFDESLPAGEEPELCARIRALGYKILHVGIPMVWHDSGISNWSQYWRRAVRSGEAYAEVCWRQRKTSGAFWQETVARNYRRGMLYALAGFTAILATILYRSLLPLALALLAWILLGLYTASRTQWKSDDRMTRILYGIHSHFVYLPLLFGQLRYQWRTLRQS